MMEHDVSSAPGPQSSGSGSSGPASLAQLGSQRKERGAIAAQACDTCRSRKQKCDEKRPKCSTCDKFKLECHYREPQPTKKDKTLTEILDRLKSLEGKIDSLSLQRAIAPVPTATSYAQMHPSILAQAVTLPMTSAPGLVAALPTQPFHLTESAGMPRALAPSEHEYRYGSSIFHMFAWPALQPLLADMPGMGDPSTIERDGPALILGLHPDGSPSFAPDDSGSTTKLHTTSLGIPLDPAASPGMLPAGLDWDAMQRLSKAYFDSFNFLHPVLDRAAFVAETLPAVVRRGFDKGVHSTIAFLVFALGEAAMAGVAEHSYVDNGRGRRRQPPGLALFNEARKRMGFNLTECSLENVQIFALSSSYYGTCSHHLEDYWRMATSASLACQALIASNSMELASPQLEPTLRTDLTKRLYWYCSIMEMCLNLALGLPKTGLEKMESIVGLPDFGGSCSEEDYLANQSSHYQEHFVSQIALRRLLVGFHNTLSQEPGHGDTPRSSPIDYHTIQHLALQLEQWRGMLPPHLRWHEDSPGAFPSSDHPDQQQQPQIQVQYTTQNTATYNSPPSQPLSPALSTAVTPTPSSTALTPPLMFTSDLSAPPAHYPFMLDIQVALLRSRYYHAKHILHRPFLYKALHSPASALMHDDAAGVATCLRAALRWPVAMAPVAGKKRLLPGQPFWNLEIAGLLLVLHLSETVPVLRTVRRSGLCGERFEEEARESVGVYGEWLRDLKDGDRAAGWCWEVVRGWYGWEE